MSAVYYDEVFLSHLTGEHPECPERLVAIMRAIEESPHYVQTESTNAQAAEYSALARVHPVTYLDYLQGVCLRGGGPLDPDTPASTNSFKAAAVASGATIDATRRVVAGELSSAFCAVRPPGHHALSERAMGFCLINHVAVAARYALDHLGINRILIIDWDIHHGNGTQDIFYDDGRVYYYSMHLHPHYPHTGASSETGVGVGEGTTKNIELSTSVTETKWLSELETGLATGPREFMPELIFISCGFDGLMGDDLGGLNLRPEAYGEATRIVVEFAAQCGHNRIVSLLEGGYNLDLLGAAARAHFDNLPL